MADAPLRDVKNMTEAEYDATKTVLSRRVHDARDKEAQARDLARIRKLFIDTPKDAA